MRVLREPRIAHLVPLSLVSEKYHCLYRMISTRLSTWCFLEWIYVTGKSELSVNKVAVADVLVEQATVWNGFVW
jgi:hypothetical protein